MRVVAVFDDLLLGSNVLGMLRAAGHEARLTGDAAAAHPDGAARRRQGSTSSCPARAWRAKVQGSSRRS